MLRDNNIEELKYIPGSMLRDNNWIINTGLGERVENLDDIPIPARDLLNMKYYTLPTFFWKRRWMQLELCLQVEGVLIIVVFVHQLILGDTIKFFSSKKRHRLYSICMFGFGT